MHPVSAEHTRKHLWERLEMKRTTLLVFVTLLFIAGFTWGQVEGQSQSGYAEAVPAGLRILIGLQSTLDTKDAKAGDQFRARTLEPLTMADGRLLSAGIEIRGHVDKVESGRKAGRARIWLAFDEIKTSQWRPLVAVVDDVPGIHSLKVDYNREGEIEARTSKRQEEAEAAAAGAFVGAAGGVAAHNGKGAAEGAAAGAATAFMVASGLGQEITLAKGTKLELILDRPIYVGGN
jgi:hypothetical protein